MIELLIVVAIVAVIAVFAVPRLLRARMTANETSAIASIRTIGSAELLYSRSCGDGGFAASLPTLGVPPPGSTAAFLPPDLTSSATPTKSGYVFSVAPGAGATPGPADCHGSTTQSAYYASAVPTTLGITGTRSFATAGLPVIWQELAGTAPTEPFGPPATPVQ